MTEPRTQTLEVPGATVIYDVRRNDSNHGGFLGGEYGQTGDPGGFAAKLRDVLSESR